MSLRRGPAVSVCLTAILLTTFAPPIRSAPEVQTVNLWLKWTATGDDGVVGRASRYDVRYSARPLAGTDTLSWWNQAAMIDMTGRIPSLPGMPDSVQITGLALGSTYYALIRVADEVPNWSRYSNLAVMNAITSVEGSTVTPPATRVHAAPNPFGSATILHFTVAETQQGEVAAFDARGRLVRRLFEGALTSGEHRITWDGRDDGGQVVGSGVYFLRVRSKTVNENAKVFRLR